MPVFADAQGGMHVNGITFEADAVLRSARAVEAGQFTEASRIDQFPWGRLEAIGYHLLCTYTSWFACTWVVPYNHNGVEASDLNSVSHLIS